MKLVFNDVMVGLRSLIAQAETTEGSHVIVSKAEMTAIIRHADSRALFPSYFNRIDVRRQQIQMKFTESKKRVNNPAIASGDLQAEFDKQTQYERQLRNIEEEVPAEVRTESGVVVKVSMVA
jgi:hypothetical protein